MIEDFDDTQDVPQPVQKKRGDGKGQTPEPEDWRPLGYEW